jgi:hypothetical protein
VKWKLMLMVNESSIVDCTVNCKKCGVVFDSVVSVCDVVNSRSIELQVLHLVPSVQIDKTDGCKLYVSKEAMDVKLVTSKASEINVVVPTEDGDVVCCTLISVAFNVYPLSNVSDRFSFSLPLVQKEYAVPEQFITSIGTTSLSTVPNAHM